MQFCEIPLNVNNDKDHDDEDNKDNNNDNNKDHDGDDYIFDNNDGNYDNTINGDNLIVITTIHAIITKENIYEM